MRNTHIIVDFRTVYVTERSCFLCWSLLDSPLSAEKNGLQIMWRCCSVLPLLQYIFLYFPVPSTIWNIKNLQIETVFVKVTWLLRRRCLTISIFESSILFCKSPSQQFITVEIYWNRFNKDRKFKSLIKIAGHGLGIRSLLRSLGRFEVEEW